MVNWQSIDSQLTVDCCAIRVNLTCPSALNCRKSQSISVWAIVLYGLTRAQDGFDSKHAPHIMLAIVKFIFQLIRFEGVYRVSIEPTIFNLNTIPMVLSCWNVPNEFLSQLGANCMPSPGHHFSRPAAFSLKWINVCMVLSRNMRFIFKLLFRLFLCLVRKCSDALKPTFSWCLL